MASSITLIGFGEAGRTFASAAGWAGAARAFDRKTDDPATAAAQRAAYAAAGVKGCDSAAAALTDAQVILSLVTADQALAAAEAAAATIAPGALWCDMNSVAPETKRAAAAVIAAGGGRYVDVAVMAPVQPAALGVPLLVSGPDAEAGADALRGAGFAHVRVVAGGIGAASSIKMIRSVVIKGIEALTAEAMQAAAAAGLVDEVLGALGGDWATRADYNLDRMLEHGTRRAAEMEEVAKTLRALGIAPEMTRGTITRQRSLGALTADTPPAGLAAKLALIRSRKKARAA